MRNREDVKEIFDPLVDDIKKLVAEQVSLVRAKRLSDRRPMAEQIKVCDNKRSGTFQV
jgi:hypothetical protein